MAQANIVVSPTTYTGTFNVPLVFDGDYTGVDATIFTLTAIDGNGITGITFDISGSGANYNVEFYLPANVTGSFRIEITGMVTPASGGTPEAVMATAATVAYDNTTSITATLGDPVPLDGGYISVPVTFAENVIVPSKTVFAVNPPTGETLLAEIEYVLLGENMAYELLFSMPPDRREGQFEISANGDVWKIATKLWKPVAMATPKVVNYILDVPRIVNMRMPTNGVYDLEGPVDILVEYNTTVTGWNLNNTITRDSTTPSFAIFEIDGAELGTPTPYKWVGTDDPDFEAIYPLLPNERRENGTYNTEANDTALANLGWQKLAAPPPGDPTPNMNGFDEDGQWHGEEGKFYLIRFSDPQVLGFFELREILGHVRGPGPISSNL